MELIPVQLWWVANLSALIVGEEISPGHTRLTSPWDGSHFRVSSSSELEPAIFLLPSAKLIELIGVVCNYWFIPVCQNDLFQNIFNLTSQKPENTFLCWSISASPDPRLCSDWSRRSGGGKCNLQTLVSLGRIKVTTLTSSIMLLSTVGWLVEAEVVWEVTGHVLVVLGGVGPVLTLLLTHPSPRLTWHMAPIRQPK